MNMKKRKIIILGVKEAIKAKFDNGVLNIELPKKELTQNNSNRILIE